MSCRPIQGGTMTDHTLAIHPATDGFGSHDPSAVLFADGSVAFGVEEGRLVRRKHAPGTFPTRAVRACLSHCDLALSDLESVLVPWEPLERDGAGSRAPPPVDVAAIERRLKTVGRPVPPVETRNHHRCHAASAFLPSGFDEALVLTVDGRGTRDATVVWVGDSDGLRRVATYDPPNSLGYLYAAVTGYLGYRIFGGEGKVMGLAPYGRPDPAIESRLRSVVDTGVDYDVTDLVGGGVQAGIDRLADLFDRPRTAPEPSDEWERDLAHVTQRLLEETVLDICATYCDRYDLSDVCLAGGVALNCKLNQRVAESPGVDRAFVQPVAGDAGAPLGAGLLDGGCRDPMSTVYWGPSYSRSSVRRCLDRQGVAYDRPADPPREVAELLADGAIVGWFQGRLEMGPRALGNRSIIADPRSADACHRVNAFVKGREAWRPCAPSLLADAAPDYLERPAPAPYMIRTFDVRPEVREEIPAVVHPADGTTRPQTVREAHNPRFSRLLAAFEDLTGVPVLLNTSFNRRGEPIVATPDEAVRTFRDVGLDALVIEDFLVGADSTGSG